MSNQFSGSNDIAYLESQIKIAQQTGKPIDEYVLKEIDWLKQQLKMFLDKSIADGKDLKTDYSIAQIEIQQYCAMKQLAEKINYPTNEYDENIKRVQSRIFGEENWQNFFGD